MTVEKRLLEILRCPVSGQSLTLLNGKQLEEINQAIAEGRARRSDGEIAERLEAGLATASFDRIYRLQDGIPVMLASEAIQPPQAGAA